MRAALMLLLAVCACAPPDAPDDGVLGYVDEARVVVDPDSEFPVDTNGLMPEIARALSLASRVWDMDDDTLAGWTISVRRGWMACRTSEGAAWTWGCTYPDTRTIEAARDASGCRASVLVHEMGHVTGVTDHGDPRFAVADALAAEVCASR